MYCGFCCVWGVCVFVCVCVCIFLCCVLCVILSTPFAGLWCIRQKTLSILNSITYSWVVDRRAPKRMPQKYDSGDWFVGLSSLNFMLVFFFTFLPLLSPCFVFLAFAFLKKEKQLKTLVICYSTTHLSKMVVRVTITKIGPYGPIYSISMRVWLA